MFLRRRFPFTRTAQREYRESVGPLAVPPGGANPGTLGGAFDMWLRFQADPHPDLRLAAHGAAWCGNGVRSAFRDLVVRFGARIDPPGAATTITSAAFDVDEPGGEELLRACWAFALLVEVYRVGGVMDGSPLWRVRDVVDVDLLALAPEGTVVEFATLADLAMRRLLPVLRGRCERGPTWVGPTFAGSKFMKADADLVTGGLLLEAKTVLGERRKDGNRRVGLHATTLNQLLGYVLHDLDDHYGIREAGLWQARYGHLAVWPLDRLLADLAGNPVDLAVTRAAWRTLLESGQDDGADLK